ncbi:TIGR04211 family SH3 domain-containing protein [Thiolapillus sp.]|uniref:TIGR04211 family SH3 domain-containing protein n=6 Tax=Thiolapillus sp. TaxID=2017437 RepID=UPI0025E19770|nr:TIGR04211 family SH3 domain-containing protein [Thiolapillus sp.]
MDFKITKILLLLFLLWVAFSAQAETRYVTDQAKITMRSGESAKHRIVRMLPSGTTVTVLSTNSASGYSRIRLADGKTGYVLTRQLLTQPVARDRIIKLEARIKELEASPGELSSKLAKLSREHGTLKQAHAALQSEKDAIQSELEELKRTSANAVQIAQERKTLRKQVATMSRDLADQEQEILELKNSSTQRWFLIGGGVLFGGILLGLVLPHLRVKKRKDSWGSL